MFFFFSNLLVGEVPHDTGCEFYHHYAFSAMSSADTVLNTKLRYVHTCAGGRGRKIGFNTNHYMCSHMRGRGAEAEREQNPLRKKWVQHPICRVRFKTARSKPSLSSRLEMTDPPASTPRMCEHTRGSGAGMSKSARLRSAHVWT